MPWVIGIDEAGYGPNLGPLIMTAVACRVPPRFAGADLWQVLRSAVRRVGEPDDGRPLVADSKLVYSAGRGLRALEKALTATLLPWLTETPTDLDSCLGRLCLGAKSELGREPWYVGADPLPVSDGSVGGPRRFLAASERRGIAWGLVRSVVVCPEAFNRLVESSGSKGGVLAQGLRELVARTCAETAGDEAFHFTIDKHGGRNRYAALLQDSLPGRMIVVHEEGAHASVYSTVGVPAVRFTIRPRADAEQFCVALASMVSKYLRELLMRQFNRYWQAQVPGLKPTAGYPSDAARFFAAIRPTAQRLGVPDSALWRQK